MTGAFKGLDQSDVYLTSYVSKKNWGVVDSGSNLENLGIRKIIARSGSLPYLYNPADNVSIVSGTVVVSQNLYREYRALESEGLTPVEARRELTGSYPDVTDEQWQQLEDYSGSYNDRLAYECLKVSYYTGSITEGEFLGTFTGSYDLDLQSTLTLEGGRNLTGSIFAYSIPRTCIGESIEEQSLSITTGSLEIFDREGLLLVQSGSTYEIVGDVIYNRGLILLNKDKIEPGSGTQLKWTSRLTINTWNVVCRVKDAEYNKTYNPSARSLESYTPYITAVGLYNRTGELMAIAKLSKPIKKADNIDTTLTINLDIS